MTRSMSDSEKDGVKGGVPVMFCQTAEEGGSSKQLVRALPINPRRRRKEKRRLSELMFFRCTPEDRATIKNNAAKTGLEISTYMRLQSTGKPLMKAHRRIRADWRELQRCMGVINKAGNVVNQLVLLIRRIGGNPAAANAALIELCKAARAIMAALGRGD
ncbi:MAG: hypothetical protein WCD70_09730 [Alphaproteobacteria bacterium]